VILDMILPDMGGGDVFDAIKEIDPGATVLLASGYSLEGQAERIIKRGCDDFIQKPFTIEQLSQKIRELIGNG
jgi:DNA-binding NtrC family response regulator